MCDKNTVRQVSRWPTDGHRQRQRVRWPPVPQPGDRQRRRYLHVVGNGRTSDKMAIRRHGAGGALTSSIHSATRRRMCGVISVCTAPKQLVVTAQRSSVRSRLVSTRRRSITGSGAAARGAAATGQPRSELPGLTRSAHNSSMAPHGGYGRTELDTAPATTRANVCGGQLIVRELAAWSERGSTPASARVAVSERGRARAPPAEHMIGGARGRGGAVRPARRFLPARRSNNNT